MDCLMAAISAGADAVYLGGMQYGARAFADNFSDEELLEAIRCGHLYHKKIYLTVNTLTREQELSGLPVFLRPLYEEGLDGVIAADLGVIKLIHEYFPQLPIHASTQMTLTGPMGSEMLKDLGVNRIVPARELSIKELQYLKDNTDLELEVFIHGAMCYAYSGQCLASSMLGSRSGNRGRCGGACRLPYRITKGRVRPERGSEEYPLSLKDLCGLPLVGTLMEMGIDSFKIEGRMKSFEYVYNITGLYRKYMDSPGSQIANEDLAFLEQRFNRGGLKSGYLLQHNGRDMVLMSRSGYSGSVNTDSGQASKQVRSDGTKENASSYLKPEKIRVNGTLIMEKDKPLSYVLSVARTDKHFEGRAVGGRFEKAEKRPTTYDEIEKQLSKLGNTPFEMNEFKICRYNPDAADPDDDSLIAVAAAEFPEVFCQVKVLNDLRRAAAEELTANMLQTKKRKYTPPAGQDAKDAGDESSFKDESFVRDKLKTDGRGKAVADQITGASDKPYMISVRSLEQLRALQDVPGERLSGIMISYDLFRVGGLKKSALEILEGYKEQGKGIFLRMPPVTRLCLINEFSNVIDDEALGFFDGIVCGSLESVAYLKKRFIDRGISPSIISDAGLYSFQSEAVRQYGNWGISSHVLPYELSFSQAVSLIELSGGHDFILPVYGYIPVMISAQCLRATDRSCIMEASAARSRSKAAAEQVFLYDRKGKFLPATIHCDRCENTIYNTVPLSLHKDMDKVSCMDAKRLMSFTIEDGKTAAGIASFFLEDDCRSRRFAFPGEFTRGHFIKGVD